MTAQLNVPANGVIWGGSSSKNGYGSVTVLVTIANVPPSLLIAQA
jgi:hypothetical protein